MLMSEKRFPFFLHRRHRSSELIDGGQGSSQDIFLDLEKEHASISPKVEGRITIVDEEDEVTRLAHSKSQEDVTLNAVQSTLEFSKLGEHKPLGGETQPSDTEGGGKEDFHIQTEGENSVRNSKQAVEKSLPFSDKPAGQELPQSEGSLADQTETPARGQKFRGDNKQVTQERNDEKNQGDAESNQETANDVTKGGKDQGKQGIAVEKINRNDEQNGQDPQEESSKNQPSKAESEGFQPDQEMGGASQLGPDLATEDEYWDLWEAVKVDDIDVVKNLRKEKNIRFSRFQDNKTILHLGAERNSSRVVAYLLTEGRVNPNVKDEILQGVPLHGAAEYGSVNTAKVLLEHGAEINKQDLIGNTALHIACEHDQGEMKIFLVNQGADTTVVNSDGETPDL